MENDQNIQAVKVKRKQYLSTVITVIIILVILRIVGWAAYYEFAFRGTAQFPKVSDYYFYYSDFSFDQEERDTLNEIFTQINNMNIHEKNVDLTYKQTVLTQPYYTAHYIYDVDLDNKKVNYTTRDIDGEPKREFDVNKLENLIFDAPNVTKVALSDTNVELTYKGTGLGGVSYTGTQTWYFNDQFHITHKHSQFNWYSSKLKQGFEFENTVFYTNVTYDDEE